MSIIRRIISTKNAPAAIGPYNQAVLVNDTMYISGQLGLDPESMTMVAGGVEAECSQALKNMGEILKAANMTFNNVVKCTVLMADMNDFAKVNDLYKQTFSSNYPARAAYQVARLPKDGRIEIEAVAVQGIITDAK